VLVISFNITLWHYVKDMIARSPFNFSWGKFTFTHFHGFCKDRLNEFERKWPKSPQLKDFGSQEDYDSALEYFFKVTVPNAVIESIDADSIYDVPLLMKNEELDKVVLEKMGIKSYPELNMADWEFFIDRLKNPQRTIKIGLVGKYIELKDSYKSIIEAFIHAGVSNNVKVQLVWLHSEEIEEKNVAKKLKDLQGVLVAPGFGERGIEGKIVAIKYVRENNIPFLGICLGMQCAVIEFARNVIGLKDAHSSEMNPNTIHPVIDLLESQKKVRRKGGTMRLGSYPCSISPNTKAFEIYNTEVIKERHRHRFEFNNDYLADFENAGMNASGFNPEQGLVEIVEIKSHPWFVGVQYHPEYKSTVAKPHPLFVSFVKAALENSNEFAGERRMENAN
jgi:CTP synthase